MKVLLRHSESRLYYATGERWVTDPARAYDFDDVELAVQQAARERLFGMEIVLSCNYPPGEVFLPLRTQAATLAASA